MGGAPCTRDSDELQRARSARGAPGAALVGERPRTAAAGALASLAEKQEASETSRLTVNEARGVETGKAGAGAQPGAAKAAVHPKGGGDGGYIGEASSRELEVPDGAAGGAGPERVSLAAVKVGDAVARVRTAAGDAVVLGTVAHSDAGLVARLEEADRALRARYVDGEGEGEAM